MSNTEYSSKKWLVCLEKGSNNAIDIVIREEDSNGEVICRVSTFNSPIGDKLPTAAMIAAAPEMFAALHIARMQISADMITRIQQPTEREANEIILEVIDNAIAKAEGEV